MPAWLQNSLAACLLLSAAFVAEGPSKAEPYRLETQERLLLRVIAWQADTNQYGEVATIGGEYTIGPSGTISVPTIGEIQASGRTTGELASAVSEGLRARLGVPDLTVSIELLAFRPIYVVGDVDKPGEYAFRPELTVLQAVSLAGGHSRLQDLDGLRLGRDAITAEGVYELARLEMRRMIARRARLQAEVAGAASIEFPSEMTDDADGIGGRLMTEERAIMGARREALVSQLDALSELKSLLTAELESLAEKIKSQERQLDLAEDELNSVSSLVQKGVVAQSRGRELEREVASLQTMVIDLETAVLRARQDISRADRDALDLKNNHASLVLTELQETEATLDDLAARARTASGLYAEATTTAPALASALSEARNQPPTYAIARRHSDGRLTETVAQEGDVVRPGDVIKVLAPSLPEMTGAAVGSGLSAAPILSSGLESERP
jgi:protein involved in polysaccharide export with SLBB domain